jgi:hypothetical protein
MTDETKAPDETKNFSSQFSDPNGAHAELESHRAKAIEHFGGHVHVVNSNTTSVPMHDASGNHTGHTFMVTSVWKKAPPEPEPVIVEAAGTFAIDQSKG